MILHPNPNTDLQSTVQLNLIYQNVYNTEAQWVARLLTEAHYIHVLPMDETLNVGSQLSLDLV